MRTPSGEDGQDGPDRGEGPATASAAVSAALLAGLVASTPGVLPAQEGGIPSARRDTMPEDSVRFTLEDVRVEATQPTITGGGASAVQLTLDSVAVVPSPTLAEVLDRMPLIRIRTNSRGQQQPSLRGMEERQIAVLVDGVPLTVGWDNRTDLSVVPLTSASQVEMVRGLSSVLAGPNVLGGVVKVGITHGPFPESYGRPYRIRTEVNQRGAYQLAGEIRNVWRDGEERLSIRAGGGFRDSPGSALADGLPSVARNAGGELVNSDLEHSNGFVAARYRAEGGAWVSLSTMGFTSERGVTPELHILGGPEPEPRFWRIPEEWRSVTSLSAGTGWRETPLGSGDLEATVGLDLRHLEIDAFDGLSFADSVEGETGNDRTLTFRLLGDHTLGEGMFHAAATFAETRHEQILPEESGVFQQRLWSFGVEAEHPVPSAWMSAGAPEPLRELQLTLGLSGDGSAYPRTGDKPRRGDIWSWGGRLALRTSVGDGLVDLHGGVSRKVRFPALRELFSGALGKFVPNPDLGPLKLRVGEVGATVHLPGLELQGTLFQQRLRGAIVRAVVEGGRFQRQNRGETRASGAELVANWRLPGGGSLRSDVTLQNVTLRNDDGEVLEDEEPEYQPEVVVGGELSYAVPLDLRARVRIEFLGEQSGANPETGRFVRVEPSTYLELGLSRRFDLPASALPPFRLSATVENLTDDAIFDQLGLPRPGRTLRFGLEF